MDEEQIEVFINKLQRKKNDLKKKKTEWRIPKRSPNRDQTKGSKPDHTPSKYRKVLTSAEKDFLKNKRDRKLRLMREGKCIQCESESHVIADCAEYAKIQAENKKRIEAQGKKWISWEDRKAMKQAKLKTKQVNLTSNYGDRLSQTPPKSLKVQTKSSRDTARPQPYSSGKIKHQRSRSHSNSRSISPRYNRFDNSETKKLYSIRDGIAHNYLCLSIKDQELPKSHFMLKTATRLIL